MKILIKYISGVVVLSALTTTADAQSIKTNIPLWLTGSPNIGFEYTLTRQVTLNTELFWMPYMFKKGEEVFRVLEGTVEARHYWNPSNFYTNDSWDGFYVGPYAMYGNFNIGLIKNKDKASSIRRKGWGVSGGISAGYKFAFGTRLALDINIGLGYAHLQYDKYLLGGEYANYPIEVKDTRQWIGPTKFGVHIVYNIFR
ncbi:MAG: DUF3575 domain-containing protein [Mediterranea sp.]|nr:DUF3575 domain-containing protein [Mediterranea sp.]